jgi:molybdopterin-synthase adenylyltransferase
MEKLNGGAMQNERYERQLWMKSVGEKGQKKLQQSSVLVIGAGGLGSPLLSYLAASGIGTLGIVDYDHVQLSNLNRQTLYQEQDIGLSKALSAKKRLLSLNSSLSINTYPQKLGKDNAMVLFDAYDVIFDATDNYPTRYLINDTCVQSKKPLFFGSVSVWSGMFFAWIPNRKHACFRCLYPNPLDYDTAQKEKSSGIIGATPGFIGSLMASQAIQFLISGTFGLEGQFFWVDLEKGTIFSYATKILNNCIC